MWWEHEKISRQLPKPLLPSPSQPPLTPSAHAEDGLPSLWSSPMFSEPPRTAFWDRGNLQQGGRMHGERGGKALLRLDLTWISGCWLGTIAKLGLCRGHIYPAVVCFPQGNPHLRFQARSDFADCEQCPCFAVERWDWAPCRYTGRDLGKRKNWRYCLGGRAVNFYAQKETSEKMLEEIFCIFVLVFFAWLCLTFSILTSSERRKRGSSFLRWPIWRG